MNNKIMFIIGCLIFIIYLFFLLKIIKKQNKIEDQRNHESFDTNDLDGIGNQGRFPNKN
ncbi:hypothetical protein N9V25_01920 [Flavobacteriaceae bacterium]|jgi:phosphotransferase system  glucose/maltose/N-acetylglucosamine-specific IIC component|nr:hypothetical protein [Flavobacteriaceae bacterium]MDB2327804.1 hypothetical protein [Flavobacteriaceae bacterium]